MAEDKKTQKIPLWGQILCGVITIIVVVSVVVGLNGDKKDKESSMPITEAQTKCMLMEEADLVNTMGEAFGDDTTEKAKNTCLSQWDLSKNPDNTQEKFIEVIQSDWEERKDEILEGYTLQQLYDESK